jgi:hypothetical protein
MKIFPDRVEFCFETGIEAVQQKAGQHFTDKKATELFKVSLWYAQHDGGGDHRLDATKQEKNDHRVWQEISRRAMAGILVDPPSISALSFETRLSHSSELGGVVVLKPELPILGDMVEWLPGRVDRIPASDAPNYNTLLRSIQPHVLHSLRNAERVEQIAVAAR